jgi:hypothetical protein
MAGYNRILALTGLLRCRDVLLTSLNEANTAKLPSLMDIFVRAMSSPGTKQTLFKGGDCRERKQMNALKDAERFKSTSFFCSTQGPEQLLLFGKR